MERGSQTNMRPGHRFLCGLIALMAFGYLVEIFIMGAPDFSKHRDHVYNHAKDPIPFWIQFAAVGALGCIAAYFSMNWERALAWVKAIEERDRKRLEAAGPEVAREMNRYREAFAVWLTVIGIILAAFLAAVSILS